MNNLYDIDFNLWSKKQAQLLREGKFNELDLEHLVEEVEELGKGEYKDCCFQYPTYVSSPADEWGIGQWLCCPGS